MMVKSAEGRIEVIFPIGAGDIRHQTIIPRGMIVGMETYRQPSVVRGADQEIHVATDPKITLVFTIEARPDKRGLYMIEGKDQ